MNSTKTAANDSASDGVTKNLVSICPFFIVKDLQASVAFYRERLGFQLDFQGPEGDVNRGRFTIRSRYRPPCAS